MWETVAGFDWDAGNLEKCQKHGVPIGEIEALLSSEPRVAPDPDHSEQEDRLIAVGRNAAGRPLFVAFTFPDEGRPAAHPSGERPLHAQE